MKAISEETGTKAPEGVATGATAGGLVAGIAGLLAGLGIPEEEAKEYESNVKEGQILVLVEENAGNKANVQGIFRNNNASNVDCRAQADVDREGESAVNEDVDTTAGREGLNRGTLNDNSINRPRH